MPKLVHKYPMLNSAAPVASAAPLASSIITTPISQLVSFRNVGRDKAISLLNGKLNTYMFRKSSLFPNDDNVYVITVHFLNDQSRPDFANLLITQRTSQDRGREYMYVNEMLLPEAGGAAWSNHWFTALHTMIKTRFPGILGPALLPAAGGRRKTKKSNRTSRHKSTKKSNRTMLRKQMRRTRH
jgi:hypothetical protein